jgi:hypothetical protein
MVGILLIAIASFYFIFWLFLATKSKRDRKKIHKAEQNRQHEIHIAQLRAEEEQAERKRIHAERVAREEQESQVTHALKETLKLQQEAQKRQELEAGENRKKLKSQIAEALKKQEAEEAKRKLAYKQELEKEKAKRELALKEEQLNAKRQLEREASELRAKHVKRQLELEEADTQAKLLEQKTIEAKKKRTARKQVGRLININEFTAVELEAAINEAINQDLIEAEFYNRVNIQFEWEAFELDAEALEVALTKALKLKALESEAEYAGVNSVAKHTKSPRLLTKTPEALLQRLLPRVEAQKPDWLEFQKLLGKHNISRLYHFTDRENLASIRASGGLLSWYSCKENDISIARPGGSEFSWHLDTNKGLADYVRLSFIPDHPMMYIARGDGRIKSPIVLEIDPVVIFLQQTKFSSMNAAKSGVFAAGSLEKFSELKFNVFHKRYFDLVEDEKPYYQAEVLIHRMLPAKYILNLNRFPA